VVMPVDVVGVAEKPWISTGWASERADEQPRAQPGAQSRAQPGASTGPTWAITPSPTGERAVQRRPAKSGSSAMVPPGWRKALSPARANDI
jgi:hypothetical protein